MEPDTAGDRSSVLYWATGLCAAIALGAWLMLMRLSPPNAPGSSRVTAPPAFCQKLTNCTRLEIHYLPSALECLFPGEQERTLLNSTEIEYLQSLETVTVDDRESIQTLAAVLAQPLYIEKARDANDLVKVIGERGGEMLTSFALVGRTFPFGFMESGSLKTEDGMRFCYRQEDMNVALLALGTASFALRRVCAENLSILGGWSRPPHPDPEYGKIPGHWCDSVKRTSQELTDLYGKDAIGYRFACPGAPRAACSYAMNPLCVPESPSDTVFLFESRPGWNQHGGPELFTLDNHHPKGGCVLLNDGTVKFIRTMEELRQLRWK